MVSSSSDINEVYLRPLLFCGDKFEKMRPHLKKCDLAREMCGWVYFPCVLRYPALKKCDQGAKCAAGYIFNVHCVI